MTLSLALNKPRSLPHLVHSITLCNIFSWKASVNISRTYQHSVCQIEVANEASYVCYVSLCCNCPDLTHSSCFFFGRTGQKHLPPSWSSLHVCLERRPMETTSKRDGKRKKNKLTYKQITKWWTKWMHTEIKVEILKEINVTDLKGEG